jgi:hypothetical protein
MKESARRDFDDELDLHADLDLEAQDEQHTNEVCPLPLRQQSTEEQKTEPRSHYSSNGSHNCPLTRRSHTTNGVHTSRARGPSSEPHKNTPFHTRGGAPPPHEQSPPNEHEHSFGNGPPRSPATHSSKTAHNPSVATPPSSLNNLAPSSVITDAEKTNSKQDQEGITEESIDSLTDPSSLDCQPTYALFEHREYPAPQTFELPEVLSYCLSADLSTLLYCSGNTEEILQCPIHRVRAHGGLLLRHVHFDDRFRVLNALEEALLCREPVVVAYRWNPPKSDEPTILVNHCVAAQSDLGEVLTGTIFRVTSSLQEELGLLATRQHSLHIQEPEKKGERSDLQRAVLLNSDLEPFTLSQYETSLPSEGTRCIPFLSQEKERQVLHELSCKLQVRNGKRSSAPLNAQQQLFYAAKVYEASLKRVERETFSPHYIFTLREITESYMVKEELKSLRRLRTHSTSASATIRELSHLLHKAQQCSHQNPEVQELLDECCSTIATAEQSLLSQQREPFISGREVLFRSLSTLSTELRSDVELNLNLETARLSLWRSVAEEYLEVLSTLAAVLLPIANATTRADVTLRREGEYGIQVEFLLTLRGKYQQNAKEFTEQLEAHWAETPFSTSHPLGLRTREREGQTTISCTCSSIGGLTTP